MRLHLIYDKRTGETRVRGSNGLLYTSDELEHIRARAKAGEPEAVARLRELELPPPTSDRDAREQLRQIIDDCPECRALRALGETPIVVDGHALESERRGLARFKRPRWRTLKRTAGRP